MPSLASGEPSSGVMPWPRVPFSPRLGRPTRARNQEATHPWPRSLPPASLPPAPGAPAPAPLIHWGSRLASAGQAMEGSSCDRLQTGTTRMIQEVQLSNLRSCQGPECLGGVQSGGPGRRPGACRKDSRPPAQPRTHRLCSLLWTPGTTGTPPGRRAPQPHPPPVPSARDGGVTPKAV